MLSKKKWLATIVVTSHPEFNLGHVLKVCLLRSKHETKTRRIIHYVVTRHPTDNWVAQQLRQVTPYGLKPHFLLRDRDRKFGSVFKSVVYGTNIDVLLASCRSLTS